MAALPDPPPLEVDALALRDAREAQPDLVLLDVREPHEWAICGFSDALQIPLGSLEQRLGEVPTDRPVVVYCRSGARSLNATRFLRAHGVARATNLRGGVLGWAAMVDPSWRTY